MSGVYVDFHNTDSTGRVRLNTIGSIQDLSQQGIILRDGLALRLYCEEFEVSGVVEFSKDEHIWTARFDWEKREELLRHFPPGRRDSEVR